MRVPGSGLSVLKKPMGKDEVFLFITHSVWYICQHLGYIDGKCYHIYIPYMDPMGNG